ncbi:MAG: ATP-binding protein [Planctomycetes bacterium]|nr:ATP-binding protein [Planctomycetota bacterium]
MGPLTTNSAATRWSFALELAGCELNAADPVATCEQALARAGWPRESIDSVALIVAELWHNALEHGVLGLDSALKERAGGFSDYYMLRERLLRENRSGRVRIELSARETQGELQLAIEVEDSGSGFDPRAPRALLPGRRSGRGLTIVRDLCELLEFNARGNVARAMCRWDGPPLG